MKKLPSIHDARLHIARAFVAASAVTTALTFLFLVNNMSIRLDIIHIQDLRLLQPGAVISGVGTDAPIIIPLVVSTVLLITSMVLSKRPCTKLQIIIATVIINVAIMWTLGLHHETKNLFEIQSGL